MKTTILTLIAIVPSLVACSPGVPTESDGRQVFENRYGSLVENGTIIISSFEKIDGAKAELLGREIYELEFAAEIGFPKGLIPECTDKALNEAPDNTRVSCNNATKLRGLIPKEVGSQEEMTGKLVFQKTEKGWRGADGQVYREAP